MPKKIYSSLFVSIFFCLHSLYAQDNSGSIKGNVTDETGAPIENVNILLDPLQRGTVSNKQGDFYLANIPYGEYSLVFTHLAFKVHQEFIVVKSNKAVSLQIVLSAGAETINGVEVVGTQTFKSHSFMPQTNGAFIAAGKKNEVISLHNQDVNLAENLPRQMFAKVPGVMVWEMDGTGNQVGISTRGLNPHRSWELHVQQNNHTTNSDLFGYPESHYNPPAEALERIEIIRGSGALQYGPQFGGLLNYVIKNPDTTKAMGLETQQTVGSFGMFGSFNAIGGKVGKFTYYGYYNFRRSDGWRQNSDYHFNAWHASVGYQLSSKISLKAEFSHMSYINHFAAGLTEAQFDEDPRYSNRPRNYFNPTMYIPALDARFEFSKNTLLTVHLSGIIGERNSVQFINLPTVDDTINIAQGNYNPRQVDRDYYHSYSGEIKLMQHYSLLNNKSHLAVGVRYGNCKTLRRQKGKGTSDSNFDLSLISPYEIDLTFKTYNYAFFAENVFNITDKFSVTPGFRLESVETDMTGFIRNLPGAEIPFDLKRSFPLFGIGLEYNLHPLINVYGNFTQNYRPVLHSDLIPATDFDKVDSDLRDAKGNNSEAGIRGQWNDFLQFDINYFRLQYDDRIGTLVVNENNSTYFYHTNIGDMVNQGVELYGELHPLGWTNNRKGWDLFLFSSTAYNHARYIKGTVRVSDQNIDIKGNKVEGIPEWISRNGLTFQNRHLSATAQLSYVSENFSDALNTVSTPSGINGLVPQYWLFDTNLTYRFLDRYNVKLSCNNITNKQYYTRRATGYPGPGILPSDGRSFLVSFGAAF